MDKLQVQATSFLLTKELPPDLLEQLQGHKYNTMTDLVNKLIDEELESWQYCYVHQYRPEDQSIPEYIVQTVGTEQIVNSARELVESDSPVLKEDNPFTRNRQVVEASGGREEYCELQIDLYKQVCAKSIQKKLTKLVNDYSEDLIPEDDVFVIGKDLAEEVGIWRWYLYRNTTEEGSPEKKFESDTFCEWIISEKSSELLDLIDEHLPNKVDLDGLSARISGYDGYNLDIDS